MGGLGIQELIVIGLFVLILFGGKKIPEFMRGLGKGIREFNDAKDNVKREIEEGIKEKDKTTTIQRLSSLPFNYLQLTFITLNKVNKT